MTAPPRATELTNNNLATVFGVTLMTIYNWRHGRTTKSAFPKRTTPASVRGWALRNEVPMLVQPASLLGAIRAKRGPKPRIQSTHNGDSGMRSKHNEAAVKVAK